jgi:hypothetical protein
VLEHHAQLRMARERRREHLGDEARLAVEHVDLAAGDLAVHLQWHAELGHARQGCIDVSDVGDTGIGVGGGAGRVELAAEHRAAGACTVDFFRCRAVGQVKGHQRREICPGRQRGHDARTVLNRRVGGGDRRLQIGHHDGARETRGGERQHGGHRGAVAQVQVPVVGTANFDFHDGFRRYEE